MKPGFLSAFRREIKRLTSRPIYLAGIFLIPLIMGVFFVSMLSPGLPRRVPSAIVDLDHSQLSRKVTRSLEAMELVDIVTAKESYNAAIQAVQNGEIFGFFVIPEDFEKDAQAGNPTTLTFYSNLTYYVPGTLVYKGFKTMAVTTSGALVSTTLTSDGIPQGLSEVFLQPMTIQTHPLNNPWVNYSYYLSTSFLPGVLELMIFLMTVLAVCHEFKEKTSPAWLASAGGNIYGAVFAKLLPQTIMFTAVAFALDALMFGYLHFPMNGLLGNLLLGSFLFVLGCQGFALIVCEILPNLRLAFSVCSLIGILAFSVAAFSFPVQAMYGAIGIFSYILPVRYYFLIYIDQALNGIPLYFSRIYYAALLVFPILATIGIPLLRRQMKKPVYVP